MEPTEHTCPGCNQRFKSARGLAVHFTKICKIAPATSLTCKDCQKSYATKQSLQRHRDTQHAQTLTVETLRRVVREEMRSNPQVQINNTTINNTVNNTAVNNLILVNPLVIDLKAIQNCPKNHFFEGPVSFAKYIKDNALKGDIVSVNLSRKTIMYKLEPDSKPIKDMRAALLSDKIFEAAKPRAVEVRRDPQIQEFRYSSVTSLTNAAYDCMRFCTSIETKDPIVMDKFGVALQRCIPHKTAVMEDRADEEDERKEVDVEHDEKDCE
jgi:hypothetical protein